MSVPAARNSILDLMGPTPVVQLGNIGSLKGAAVFAKLEHLNPTGSHKDRIAAAMLDQAEAEGWLSPGATVIEASCGNLGVALALVCAVRGYRLVLAMPRSVNPEFLPLIQAYGAQLELTPAELGIAGAIAHAKQLLAGSPGSYMPAQYENPMNVIAHRRATGAELVRAVELTGKKAAAFVMTLATGGTFCGVGEAMRDAFPAIHLAAVQIRPHLGASSSLRTSTARPDSSIFPGVSLFADQVIEIDEAAAREMARRLARKEGLLVGTSTGANALAAVQVAAQFGSDHGVYTLCCDTGERYFTVDERA
ncbi:MAG TPA: PLP-dependent cysteine synthase family protein [Myxococcaceae bacterium]|nr:PLP-dependent cysteine synthase family protein [Myxococcaceae bacterium]